MHKHLIFLVVLVVFVNFAFGDEVNLVAAGVESGEDDLETAEQFFGHGHHHHHHHHGHHHHGFGYGYGYPYGYGYEGLGGFGGFGFPGLGLGFDLFRRR